MGEGGGRAPFWWGGGGGPALPPIAPEFLKAPKKIFDWPKAQKLIWPNLLGNGGGRGQWCRVFKGALGGGGGEALDDDFAHTTPVPEWHDKFGQPIWISVAHTNGDEPTVHTAREKAELSWTFFQGGHFSFHLFGVQYPRPLELRLAVDGPPAVTRRPLAFQWPLLASGIGMQPVKTHRGLLDTGVLRAGDPHRPAIRCVNESCR